MGPSINSLEKIMQLVQTGMDVARLNLSHGTHEEHIQTINLLKEAREKMKQPLAIMLDTKGPEIRLGKVPKEGIEVHPGSRLLITKEQIEGTKDVVSIRPAFVLDHLKVGITILIDNGYILSKVVEVTKDGIIIEIENSGVIYSSKGVNIPNCEIPLPSLTEKDVTDIEMGCQNGIDMIAASFVRSPENVIDIKRILARLGRSDIQVIAKIENNEGVHNFDGILQVADGIMVARGDLGVEVPLAQVPKLQKMMIRKCNIIGKPAVTATQMLESMMNNPRPTRAEASDVANAIYDGTSAVMLSGETAIGKYPIETVQIMKDIVRESEHDFDYKAFFELHSKMTYNDVPSALTLSTVKTAYSLGAKAIFAFTHSGTTARLLARLKPQIPIVALTPSEETYHQLAVTWGVTPVLCPEATTIEEAFTAASRFAIHNHLASYGDLVVVTSGSPLWVPGTTNMILVESIGDVLVRGHMGYGSKVHGNVTLVASSDLAKSYLIHGQILVIPKYEAVFDPLIAEASAVILQNTVEDKQSEKELIERCLATGKTVITRVDGAFRILREGQLVTIDPEKALVYKGVVR